MNKLSLIYLFYSSYGTVTRNASSKLTGPRSKFPPEFIYFLFFQSNQKMPRWSFALWLATCWALNRRKKSVEICGLLSPSSDEIDANSGVAKSGWTNFNNFNIH